MLRCGVNRTASVSGTEASAKWLNMRQTQKNKDSGAIARTAL